VVGGSFTDPFGNTRAFLWQNGVMHDLNDPLITPNSSMVLLFAAGIDSSGQIAGWGVQKSTGQVHAFLATPIHGEAGH
jgi:probable HAF family extracellular repeat protein